MLEDITWIVNDPSSWLHEQAQVQAHTRDGQAAAAQGLGIAQAEEARADGQRVAGAAMEQLQQDNGDDDGQVRILPSTCWPSFPILKLRLFTLAASSKSDLASISFPSTEHHCILNGYTTIKCTPTTHLVRPAPLDRQFLVSTLFTPLGLDIKLQLGDSFWLWKWKFYLKKLVTFTITVPPRPTFEQTQQRKQLEWR